MEYIQKEISCTPALNHLKALLLKALSPAISVSYFGNLVIA
jgi:hypothetical protein